MKALKDIILEKLQTKKATGKNVTIDDSLEDIINSNNVLQIISSVGNVCTDEGGYFMVDTFEFSDDIDVKIDELYEKDPDFDEDEYKNEIVETECKKVLLEINDWIKKNNIKDVDIVFDKEMNEFDDEVVSELYDKADELGKTIKVVNKIKPAGKGKELFSVDMYTDITLYPSGVLVSAGYVGSRFFKGIK